MEQQQQKEAKTEIPLFTKTGVKERGWTEGAIKKFLGNPDKTAPNPYSKKKPEVKLFSCDRVKRIEQTEEWQDWYQKKEAQKNKRELLKKQRAVQKRHTIEENPLQSFAGRVRLEDIREEIAHDCGSFPDELIVKAQETILTALKRSWWYPVDRLILQFHRKIDFITPQTWEKIASLAQSLAEKGWKGRPVIAWHGLPDFDEKEFLHSGYHRLEALKQLRKEEKIGKDFLVPVFSLESNWDWLASQLPKEDKKILELVDWELHPLTLKELCRHGSDFFPLVTGLDNY